MIAGEAQLQKLPYWGVLSNQEKDALRGVAYLKRFAKGETIFPKVDGCLGMLVVLEGDARAYLLSDEGKEVTLFRLHEGDPCVLSASCLLSQIVFDTFMVAQTDCLLLVVPIKTFTQIKESNQAVALFLYELAAMRFSEALWLIQQALFTKLDSRLATFLLDEAARTGSLEIKMTQDQIASCMNSAREAITRMLKRFSEDGLVEVGRGRVVILDKRGLHSLL